MPPRLTVGILSYNRLHYLQALVESFLACNGRDGIEFILVDNASTEAGLQDYIASLDFFAHRVVAACPMAEALNRIVALAAADVLMILPEDMQFILLDGRWIGASLRLLEGHPEIGSITFDAQRRATLRRYFGGPRRWLARRYRDAVTGVELLSYGRQRPGIGGAGINTLTRKSVWQRLGPWRTRAELETYMDSGLGAEADMLQRYRRSGLQLQRCLLRIPAAADILTDPAGHPAKVRGGQRLGKYFAPPQGRLYYALNGPEEATRLARIQPAPAFEDAVRPLGFPLPLDRRGDLLKSNPAPGRSEATPL
jgi:glycosyltransferase involved in cell wall biosynthesis